MTLLYLVKAGLRKGGFEMGTVSFPLLPHKSVCNASLSFAESNITN